MKVLTKSDLQDWLVENIAKSTRLPKKSIGIDIPLANYGLDSLQSVIISGELEEWLNIQIEPTLFWDFPTIEKISSYIIDEYQSEE